MVFVMCTDVENGNNVGVLQTRHGLRFTLEAFNSLARRVRSGEQNFQRNDAVESGLSGLVNHTETAAADFAKNFVTAKLARRTVRCARAAGPGLGQDRAFS